MKKLTVDDIAVKAISIHGKKFTYSNIFYKNGVSYITVTCPTHGDFKQRVSSHLEGCGCNKCMRENRRIGISNFLIRAKAIHGDKFDYSLVIDYKQCKEHINVICKNHGVFITSTDHHINRGQGCPKCKLLGIDGFTDKANKIHDYKYNYSNVVYINNKANIDIICPIHGTFNQRVSDHLGGSGCPTCTESKGEKEIRKLLLNYKIKYTQQKRFTDCSDKKPLPFDFYLPEYNTCIEFNGIQHYEPVSYFGGEIKFITQQKKDNIKKDYCVKNNIKLIIIRYNEKITDVLGDLFNMIPIIT